MAKNSSVKKPRKDFSGFAFEIIEEVTDQATAPDVESPKQAHIRRPPNALHLLPPEETGVKWESARTRAAKLRARMLQFNRVYNAAWRVRYFQHGAPAARAEAVEKFVAVIQRELRNCKDPEALIFAIADALSAFPRGAPWEL